MELNHCQPQQQQKLHSRKRKRVGIVGPNKQNWSDDGGIDKLPDDVLINILSHISLKESARASVLARRWRYLWRFFNGTLQFDHRDTATGDVMKRAKFESWVNTVVELHQAHYIEGMVISFDAEGDEHLISPTTYHAVDSWVRFAMQKEVQLLELNLSCNVLYIFPLKRLNPSLHMLTSAFCHLRALRLVRVVITDEAVHHFLASCPNLEQLCIRFSQATRDIRVIDPPNLRVLEISRCPEMESVEISAANLVSLTYEGGKNSLLLEKIPNLCELTLSGAFGLFFVIEPTEHGSYSVQLEKLVLDFRLLIKSGVFFASNLPQLWSLKRLEVHISTAPGRSLLFFTSLINASPQLGEFSIQLSYTVSPSSWSMKNKTPFPVIEVVAAKAVHTHVKVVEMGGYIACSSEKQFLLELFKIGRGSIERVVIDTKSAIYDDQPALKSYIGVTTRSARNELLSYGIEATTREEPKMRAKDLASVLPKQAKLIVTLMTTVCYMAFEFGTYLVLNVLFLVALFLIGIIVDKYVVFCSFFFK